MEARQNHHEAKQSPRRSSSSIAATRDALGTRLAPVMSALGGAALEPAFEDKMTRALPTRYAAVGLATRSRDEGHQYQARPRRHTDRPPAPVWDRIADTKHIWVLVAVVYAYVTLFTLVVVLEMFAD
jgi:hypothetical protein